MPFGLKMPSCVQRLMDTVLGKDRWKFCLCYVDDLIIYSETFEEHLQHIQAVLSALEKQG